MQLQFIVALLVVLALCEGCAGMDSWKFGNDRGKSTNFTSTNSSDQPKSKGKAKMYSSGSDDGSQTMHQNPFNNIGFTAPTNPGMRGGSQTMNPNVTNFGASNASTNPGMRGGSQTTHQNVSNFGNFNAPTNPRTRNSGGRSSPNFVGASVKFINANLNRIGGNTPNAEPFTSTIGIIGNTEADLKGAIIEMTGTREDRKKAIEEREKRKRKNIEEEEKKREEEEDAKNKQATLRLFHH